jgi:hypothetical protein
VVFSASIKIQRKNLFISFFPAADTYCIRTWEPLRNNLSLYNYFVTALYTPQGGTEKSAVPGIYSAMLFIYNGLESFLFCVCGSALAYITTGFPQNDIPGKQRCP